MLVPVLVSESVVMWPPHTVCILGDTVVEMRILIPLKGQDIHLRVREVVVAEGARIDLLATASEIVFRVDAETLEAAVGSLGILQRRIRHGRRTIGVQSMDHSEAAWTVAQCCRLFRTADLGHELWRSFVPHELLIVCISGMTTVDATGENVTHGAAQRMANTYQAIALGQFCGDLRPYRMVGQLPDFIAVACMDLVEATVARQVLLYGRAQLAEGVRPGEDEGTVEILTVLGDEDWVVIVGATRPLEHMPIDQAPLWQLLGKLLLGVCHTVVALVRQSDHFVGHGKGLLSRHLLPLDGHFLEPRCVVRL
mmetsp:Transcript_129158/g.306489  ORF Transcript_129158/g.306489 Transcript_129158/m.306489 type:complete len:310 (+) Transcript_129158:707-1636(+)